MVDIVVGAIPPAHNNQSNSDNKRRQADKKKAREKRQNKNDRRREVRDGVIVTLSTKKDRRSLQDRRKPVS